MSVTDELLQNNESYAQGFDKGELGLPPAKGLVVIACMDARLIPTPRYLAVSQHVVDAVEQLAASFDAFQAPR